MSKQTEIEVIECSSIDEAEREFYLRKTMGTWQIVKPLKVGWSWKKFRYVARFSMRKVEKAYHIDDYLKDISKTLSYGIEVCKGIIVNRKLKKP